MTPLYDVFLSHSVRDDGLVRFIKEAFEAAELSVYSSGDRAAGDSINEDLREALVDSSAVVLLVTASSVNSSWLAFEVGMALAWTKPLYAVYDGIEISEAPQFLRNYEFFPAAQIQKVISEIQSSKADLSAPFKKQLVDTYVSFQIPADRLLLQPSKLGDFVRAFNRETGLNLSGERLMQELVRMRKKGALPRLDSLAHPA